MGDRGSLPPGKFCLTMNVYNEIMHSVRYYGISLEWTHIAEFYASVTAYFIVQANNDMNLIPFLNII